MRDDRIAAGRQENSLSRSSVVQPAASAIESHFKDKAHLAALAFKTFGNVSYQQYNQQRAIMSQAWNEDEEALEPKTLVSADRRSESWPPKFAKLVTQFCIAIH